MLKEINLIKVIKRRCLGCRSDLTNLPRRLIIWPERLTDLATVPCHSCGKRAKTIDYIHVILSPIEVF